MYTIMEADKLYVIIIIGMIGIFIYWYQTRLDAEYNEKVYCANCRCKMIKRKDKKQKQAQGAKGRKSLNDSDSIEVQTKTKRKSKPKSRKEPDTESDFSIMSLDTLDRSQKSLDSNSTDRTNETEMDIVNDTGTDIDTLDLDI